MFDLKTSVGWENLSVLDAEVVSPLISYWVIDFTVAFTPEQYQIFFHVGKSSVGIILQSSSLSKGVCNTAAHIELSLALLQNFRYAQRPLAQRPADWSGGSFSTL